MRHFLGCGTALTLLHEDLFEAMLNDSARAFLQVMVLVFLTFLSGEGRIPALIPPTVTTGAAVRFGVIVRSAGLAAAATVARASSDKAATDS